MSLRAPEPARHPQYLDVIDQFQYAEMDTEPESLPPHPREIAKRCYFHLSKAGM